MTGLAEKLSAWSTATTETPSEWIQKHFYVPDVRDPLTGEFLGPGPIKLAEHQSRIIDEALSKDENGLFKYSTIIYSAPKKSGKSAISSAVALYMAYNNQNSFIACLANDGKQSTDRLYGPIYTCFRLHKQYGGIFKDVNANQREVILQNYTKIEAVPCDAAGEAGSQPLATFWCFDDQTKVLTSQGWLTYHDLTEHTVYATVTDDHAFEWQSAKGVNIQDYSGDMIHIKNKRMNMKVTPNHRLIYKYPDDTEWKSDTAQNLFGKKIVLPSHTCGWKGVKLDDTFTLPATKRKPALQVDLKLFVQFLGWYLSEGCVKYKRKKDGTRRPECVLIAQSIEKNYEHFSEILQLVRELGFTPNIWSDGINISIYDIRLTTYLTQFGLCYDKYVPVWLKELPAEYLEIFLDAYRKGDGWDAYTGFAIGTTSTRMKDDLIEIGLKLGYTMYGNGHEDYRSDYLQHKIHFYPTIKNDGFTIQEYQWKKVHYKGKVFCPSTPNGTIIAQRNNVNFFTMNSELWGFDTPSKRKLFTELTVPVTLYGRAIRWVESYAGFTGVSELLEGLYHTAVIEGNPHPDFEDLQSNLSGHGTSVVFTNDKAGTFAYWDHERRMIWQDEKYYRQEAAILTASEYHRIHDNLWSSPSEAFVEESWWKACFEPSLKTLLDLNKTPVVVGIDMAVSRDCAALVAVTRSPYDPSNSIAVRGVRIITPGKKGVIDQNEDILPIIKDWHNRWNVVCWAYDPKEMAKLARECVQAGYGWFKPFGQVGPRAEADKQLHDMILNQQVIWGPGTEGDVGGPDSINECLYKHITKAGASTSGDAYRLIKLANSLHIDGAVALSQATYMAMKLSIDNQEHRDTNLLLQLQRGDITAEEFSRIVQSLHPELKEKLYEKTI